VASDAFVVLDTTNFKTVAKNLRKVAPQLARELGREIKQAGDLITVEGRANAAWSKNIPQTIKTQRRGIGVKIVIGVGSKPHEGEGPAYEGDGVSKGPLRHPVGGNRGNWTSKNTNKRPMVGPAFLIQQDAALNRIVVAIDRLLEQL
jgi:hypothetical protein